MENLFLTASRQKFRFPTEKGQITTEDLWDLPLQSRDGFNLDAVAIGLSNGLDNTKSFVNVKTEDAITQAKLDIVVHIIKTKQNEIAFNEQAAVNRGKKKRILGVIAKKQDAALEKMSLEELQAEANSLD